MGAIQAFEGAACYEICAGQEFEIRHGQFDLSHIIVMILLFISWIRIIFIEDHDYIGIEKQ
jgi:hypothetical protein